MMIFNLALILLIPAVASISAESAVLDVHSMTEINATISNNENFLLVFVSPQCSKSRTLWPNLDWAAKRLAEDKILMTSIVRVDISLVTPEDLIACKINFDFDETPKLLWIDRGIPRLYDGHPSANGIFDWIIKTLSVKLFDISRKNCDACRTSIEVMHLTWDESVEALIAAKHVELGQPARLVVVSDPAPERHTAAAICLHTRMREMATHVRAGCERLMRWHGAAIINRHFQLFSSWCSRSAHRDRAMTIREVTDCARQWSSKVPAGRLGIHDKTMHLCASDDVAPVAPVCSWPNRDWRSSPPPSRCAACRGLVDDAAFVLRRDRLGDLPAAAVRRRSADIRELLEAVCASAPNRHEGDATEGPARVYAAVCVDMWDAAEDDIAAALIAHAAAGWLAHGPNSTEHLALERKVCVDLVSLCTVADFAAAAAAPSSIEGSPLLASGHAAAGQREEL